MRKSSSVHVIVTSLSGRHAVKPAFPGDNHVSDLRAWVLEEFGMPLLCQKLVLGTSVLRDGQKISALCRRSEESKVSISVILSLEPLKAHIEAAKSRKAKTSDLSVVETLGTSAGSEGIDILIEHVLNDSDLVVRSHAIEILGRMVDKANDHALSALTDLFNRTWPPAKTYDAKATCLKLRLLALRCFVMTMQESSAIEALVRSETTSIIWDPYHTEKCPSGLSKVEAIHVFGGMMRRGNAHATDMLLEVVQSTHFDSRLRCTAMAEFRRRGVGDDRLWLAISTCIGSIEKTPASRIDIRYDIHSYQSVLGRTTPVPDFSFEGVNIDPGRYASIALAELISPSANGDVLEVLIRKCLKSGSHSTTIEAAYVCAKMLAMGDVRVFPALASGCCSVDPSERAAAWLALRICNESLDWCAERGPEAILASMLQRAPSDSPVYLVTSPQEEAFHQLKSHEIKDPTADLRGAILHVRRMTVQVHSPGDRENGGAQSPKKRKLAA